MTAVKQKKLTSEEFERLLDLSRLEVAGVEREEYLGQLGEILEYVGGLAELELEGVAETYQIARKKEVAVEDVAMEGLDHEEVMSQAPRKHRGYVMVKAVLGGRDE